MAKKKSTAVLEREVAEFNDRCPVGTKGLLRKDSGVSVETTVRNPAQILSGHSAVAWFEGISGCYLIDRFAPVKASIPA